MRKNHASLPWFTQSALETDIQGQNICITEYGIIFSHVEIIFLEDFRFDIRQCLKYLKNQYSRICFQKILSIKCESLL